MQIYKNNNGKLIQISEVGFKLEKYMQKITEDNLENIFGLEFIITEFQLNNLRIDSLAFDNESNSFIIIEYKRGNSYSVVDQGMSYLSLMLNNKADFIQELSRKRNKFIDTKSIDWSQSKVIIIADSFNRYQKESINFKDLAIELWELKQFTDGTIIYNPIKASNTSESIKTITKFETNEFDKVNKEIITYDETYHTNGKSEKIIDLYHKIKDFILGLDSNFEISYKKMYIAFKINNKNIVSMHLFVNSINIRLYGKHGSINDKYGLIKDISNVGNWGNAENEIKINSEKELLEIFNLIQQAKNNNTP